MINKSKAISLLKEYCSNSVFEHSLTVSTNAKKIAEKIKDNGYDVDVNFIEIASLLHDIGRSKTHDIMHGVEGAKIILKLLDDPAIARVCETHIGAGITKDEAKGIGLPKKDYLPKTREEKIIAHTDNITFGTKTEDIDKVVEKLENRLCKGHPSIKRVIELNEFIEKLLTATKYENEVLESFKKEVMEKDVLNRIKWDSCLNPEDFSIHYIDRVTENLKQVNFNDIEIEGDFIKTEDSMIPMHRIREIKCKGKVVWNKRRI